MELRSDGEGDIRGRCTCSRFPSSTCAYAREMTRIFSGIFKYIFTPLGKKGFFPNRCIKQGIPALSLSRNVRDALLAHRRNVTRGEEKEIQPEWSRAAIFLLRAGC